MEFEIHKRIKILNPIKKLRKLKNVPEREILVPEICRSW